LIPLKPATAAFLKTYGHNGASDDRHQQRDDGAMTPVEQRGLSASAFASSEAAVHIRANRRRWQLTLGRNTLGEGGFAMGDLVHRAKVRIVPENPGIKQAFVEPFPQAIRTGVHGGVKAWFKYQGEEELPTTLDHVVAAIGS
jgi:hypothetical protein